MKIVQINTVCGSGSVGRITVDLYRETEKAGDTPFIVYGRNPAPKGLNTYYMGSRMDFFHHVLVNFFQGKGGFASVGTTRRLIRWLETVQPDVIHLHNIHGFYLNVEILSKYLQKTGIPVVWTLHDCWPFTGHCAYFDHAGCEKWKEGCHDCDRHATAYPYALFKDNSRANYAAKKQAFTGWNLTIVTPSHWLAGLVKRSFLKDYPVAVIPNGIDLEQFHPGKENLRKPIENKSNKPMILGVANRWEERKGLDVFLELAEKQGDRYKICLVGVDDRLVRKLSRRFPTDVLLPIGRTGSVEELADIYRSADVFVNPTLEDNFPTTNLEALACGTPVVTYNTGGSPESLTPSCGVVVDRNNRELLYRGIAEVVEKVRTNTGFTPEECRKRAMEFGREERFAEYISLYHKMTAGE